MGKRLVITKNGMENPSCQKILKEIEPVLEMVCYRKSTKSRSYIGDSRFTRKFTRSNSVINQQEEGRSIERLKAFWEKREIMVESVEELSKQLCIIRQKHSSLQKAWALVLEEVLDSLCKLILFDYSSYLGSNKESQVGIKSFK